MEFCIIGNSVIVTTKNSNKIFGFDKTKPAICAQGDTKNEVIKKIRKFRNGGMV